jgi:hypothetical protein
VNPDEDKPAHDDTSFTGEIVVASRIVDSLSSGLYESPAACLKELVNNAYDADAQTVRIYVKPDADEIVIEDDGTGMSQVEFVRHFSRISESHKREDSDRTRMGRPKVGKIGIGFIAANELCDVMEIESTKQGSTELLKVAVDFAAMRDGTPEERRVKDGDAFVKGHYLGHLERAPRKEHYTRIFLRDIRGDARRVMVSEERQSLEGRADSLYGLTAESVVDRLRSPTLKSWSDFDQYSQTYLGVALNVPVAYPKGWLPPQRLTAVKDLVEEVESLGFRVLYDGTEMLKPIVFPARGDTMLRRFAFEGERVTARGYFFANHGALRPRELQGVLLRIRYAAVGEYDGSFLNYPIAESQLFKNWISGEIWADDRLEDAMNIDRKTMRVTHPAYVELQRGFHSWFNLYLRDVRKELYARGSAARRLSTARDEGERIAEALRAAKVSRVITTEIDEAWPLLGDGEDRRAVRRLTRKYTIGELYEIVLEIAAEHMAGDEFEAFVRDLTRRLSG